MRDGSPLILHYTLASLPHPRRCDAVFRIVPDSVAYLGYYKLPSKSAFLLLVYPSHLLNDVYTRPAFEWDDNEDEGDPTGMQNITSCFLKGSIGGRHSLDFRPKIGESCRGID